MFEPDVILKLELCVDHIIAIEKYFSNIKNADDLFMIDDGVYYDAVLMRLQALSEMLKNQIELAESFVISLTTIGKHELKEMIQAYMPSKTCLDFGYFGRLFVRLE